MEIKEQKPGGLTLISGYGNGAFTINGKRYEGHLLISPVGFYPWSVKSIKTIQKQSLKPLFKSDFSPEFLLFGLGGEVPDAVILARKLEKKFVLPCEVMTTGAAVRTYNVLALEGRQMAAALFAV
jgi:uncharacterized protein